MTAQEQRDGFVTALRAALSDFMDGETDIDTAAATIVDAHDAARAPRVDLDRLRWWAQRFYDALEFSAYTVDTDGQIDGHRDTVWSHDDPLDDTLRAFTAELGIPFPEEDA